MVRIYGGKGISEKTKGTLISRRKESWGYLLTSGGKIVDHRGGKT